MTETSTWNIYIKDNIQVTVPASLTEQITYVLLEQEDWCDPEIDFVREFIESGMTVLDMEAGYGVYPLVMAKEMEGEGKVIALNTNELFNQNVQENRLQDLITTETDSSALDFIRLGGSVPDKDILARGNPLVLFPASEELLQFFKALGMEIYQHIPALNILAPLEANTPLEGNLFACNQVRAEILRKNALMT